MPSSAAVTPSAGGSQPPVPAAVEILPSGAIRRTRVFGAVAEAAIATLVVGAVMGHGDLREDASAPRARAARRMFCAAGYRADQVNCSRGASYG